MKFNAKIVGVLIASSLALAGCKNEQSTKVEANNAPTATQTAAASSDNFVPTKGYQYTELKNPITNAPKVMEVFSLACSHCRKMESLVPELKKMIGENITQYHVTFNESAQAAAVLFYTAAIQSDDHPTFKQMEELFSFVQDTPKDWTPEQRKTKLDSIYTEFGMLPPSKLSEAQQKQVYTLMKESNRIVTESQLSAVPAFIIQGKYMVELGGQNSLQEFAKTIKYLSNLK